MSGLGNDVQIDVIIERCMQAIDEKRDMQARIAAAQIAAKPPETKLLGIFPTWFAVAVPIVGSLMWVGSLRSDVAVAKDQSTENKVAIVDQDRRLTSMEGDIKWLVEDAKERRERENRR